MVRLSVLDQSPVPAGSTAARALANSIDLARRTEALGFDRYWVAEHHNTPALAGSAPEILVGAIAAATDHLRVGTGGVMLSHYSALKVAEQFRVLCELYPGRIDLGVGRAPGSDQRTAAALARGGRPTSIEFYPSQIQELVGLLHDELPADSPLQGISATPQGRPAPPVWLLASSIDSASYAAHFGLPLAWAHFIAFTDGAPMVRAYQEQFRPSVHHDRPAALVAAAVICADTDEEAERQAGSIRLWRQRGLSGPIPSLDEVAEAAARGPLLTALPGRTPPIVGGPDKVRAEITALADVFGVEEVMVVTIVWDHAARVRSYELLAEAFGLTPATGPSGRAAAAPATRPGG
jgi:luciferase family oxidoreductase group 1